MALALLAVYAIWGCSYLATREAIQTIPPLLMVGGRLTLAGSLLYCGLRLGGFKRPRPEEWLGCAAIAAPLIVIANGATVYAQLYVDSGLAAVAYATSPVWMALFSGMIDRWPSRPEWIGIGLGLAGVAMLDTHANLRAYPLPAGALMLGSLSWAFGSVMSRRVRMPGSMMASAAQLLIGGVTLLALGLVTGERIAAMPTTISVVSFFYLAIFSSLIGFSAFTYLVRHARPSVALSHAYVNPAVAVAVGAIVAGETVTRLELLAIALIMAALVFATLLAGGLAADLAHRPLVSEESV